MKKKTITHEKNGTTTVKEEKDEVCCSWCGEWGLKELMYLQGGEYDWYHGFCVDKNTKYELEYLFGGKENETD